MDPAAARRRHCPLEISEPEMHCHSCAYRRVILLEIEPAPGQELSGEKLLAGNLTRTPVGFIDLDADTGKLLRATKVAKSHSWKDVPTPEI